MRSIPSRCEFCGCRFRPDRYNEDRQLYCTKPKCVQARKRKRQREWHAGRRTSDPGFRERENARCAEANRKRRHRSSAVAAPDEPAAEAAVTPYAVLGLVSQLTDTSDLALLRAHLRDYHAWGRRVAFPARSGPDPP